MALYRLFQLVPYAVVEAGLELGGLVGVVEGLLVLVRGGLAVVGGAEMALAVPAHAGALPLRRESGIGLPAVVTPYIVVRPGGGVHCKSAPECAFAAAVYHYRVVAHCLAAGSPGVRGNGLIGVRAVVAIPHSAAVVVFVIAGVGAGKRYGRYLVIDQVARDVRNRGFSLGPERLNGT